MSARRQTYAERRARADARRADRAEVEDPAVVLEAAAAFLAVRPRSIDETRRRLRQLGYPAGPVDVVLERLQAFGYLDDESFARAWVESRDRARPRSETVLRRELTLKGIDRDVVAAVLADRERDAVAGASDDGSEPAITGAAADHADEVAARRLLARRSAALAREPDPRRRRQKAYALLARNGFSPDVCARVAAESSADPVTGEPNDEPVEAAADGV
jgi:regulatory protein